MGITNHSVEVLDEVIIRYRPKTLLELGNQQTYVMGDRYGQYANWYYEEKGIPYVCADINGENNAVVIDLSKRWENTLGQFDLVTDFGVSEHVATGGVHDAEQFFNCWKIKHDLTKIGGIMISENPLTGNWPAHGQNYVTQSFYKVLCKMANYELIHLHEHPAMGNTTDGWNVVCVLQKTGNEDFISFDQFKLLDFRES